MTDTTLIEEAKQLASMLGTTPTSHQYYSHCNHSRSTIERRFGSWLAFATAAFGSIKKPTQPSRVIVCLHCEKPTKNPKFCSIRCGVVHNNANRTKKKANCCVDCQKTIDYRFKRCIGCAIETIKIDPQITVGDWRTQNKYSIHQRIRDHARRLYKGSSKPQHCKICEYSRQFDVCHIKAVKSFADDTPIVVINDLTNLVALCKNHHSEFDDGLLQIT